MNFLDDTDKSNFSKEIKIWINKLILETKKIFPLFQQKVKEIFNGDRDSLSIEGENDVEFAIGSKINMTTEVYS